MAGRSDGRGRPLGVGANFDVTPVARARRGAEGESERASKRVRLLQKRSVLSRVHSVAQQRGEYRELFIKIARRLQTQNKNDSMDDSNEHPKIYERFSPTFLE